MSSTNLDVMISDSWHEEPLWQEGGSREFLASVEFWCPAKQPTATTRKAQLSRASDKRDSLGVGFGIEERRVRDKPNWFRSHGGSAAANGCWRPARCKLTEEHDRCTLNIYVDETILQNSIYVHLLRCTDIRPADRSLFFREDCLGIHVKAGQKWLDASTEEIIYLKFACSGTINTWIALLRSYAVAEIYGRSQSPETGGLYRMWRQVQLEIVQARNLGNIKPIPELSSISMSGTEGDSSYDGIGMDVSCEIVINDFPCGRTTTKRCNSSAEWHEQFTFKDLPPFGDLLIHVYREKKPYLLGTIQIVLGHFRRGELVEGWFPILLAGQAFNQIQSGELRLRMRVDEEIVLPIDSYKAVLQCMTNRNLLDLLNDMEQYLKLERIAEHILAIAVDRGVLTRDLYELAEREVGRTSSSQNTLFRGNSVLTKTMELVMNWFGKSFLESSVGSAVRRLIYEKVIIEVDPFRSGKGFRDQERSADVLVYWCNEFWNSIYSVRKECPQELRQLFHHIRCLVEKRYESSNSNMRWQSVSSFCFLRFIVPAILNPSLLGLCYGMPPAPIQRSLTLIAKVLQSLANLNPNIQREESLKGVNKFLKDSLPAMMDYLQVVSSPTDAIKDAWSGSIDKHDRIHMMNSLRERKNTMPTLHREALLFLPHLLDVPKHLAILTSATARSMKQQRTKNANDFDQSLADFMARCLEVQNKAQRCAAELGRPSRAVVGVPLPFIDYPMTDLTIDGKESIIVSEGKKCLVSEVTRPSTAPSSPDSDRQSTWKSWSNDAGDICLPMDADTRPDSVDDVPLPSRASCEDIGPSDVSDLVHFKGIRPGHITGSSTGFVQGGSSLGDDIIDTSIITENLDESKKRKGFLNKFLPKR